MTLVLSGKDLQTPNIRQMGSGMVRWLKHCGATVIMVVVSSPVAQKNTLEKKVDPLILH